MSRVETDGRTLPIVVPVLLSQAVIRPIENDNPVL